MTQIWQTHSCQFENCTHVEASRPFARQLQDVTYVMPGAGGTAEAIVSQTDSLAAVCLAAEVSPASRTVLRSLSVAFKAGLAKGA